MDEPVSYCCECNAPIYESMGITLARDVVDFVAGKIKTMRQGCVRCGARWANNRRHFKKILGKLEKERI